MAENSALIGSIYSYSCPVLRISFEINATKRRISKEIGRVEQENMNTPPN